MISKGIEAKTPGKLKLRQASYNLLLLVRLLNNRLVLTVTIVVGYPSSYNLSIGIPLKTLTNG